MKDADNKSFIMLKLYKMMITYPSIKQIGESGKTGFRKSNSLLFVSTYFLYLHHQSTNGCFHKKERTVITSGQLTLILVTSHFISQKI